jgi:plasmid replication initiation protein
MELKNKNKVEKRNILNEIRSKHMTVQQLRLLAIYLSRINARDESTRRVRFSLVEFQKLLELNKINTNELKSATDGLLCKVAHVPNENGGYTSFPLFKECTVGRDETGAWFVELDANDKALPLFFDFKDKYFSYEVGNVLRLASVNQIRMYEILKQREKMKQPVTIQLQDLRELLGLDESVHPRFGNFRGRVLEKTQNELAANTDITFTYQPMKKGHKVAAISFSIQKNRNGPRQMCIEEYLNTLPDPAGLDEAAPDLFADALPSNLSAAEVEALRGLAVTALERLRGLANVDVTAVYDYLIEKTRLMYASNEPVRNQFRWLKSAIIKDYQ